MKQFCSFHLVRVITLLACLVSAGCQRATYSFQTPPAAPAAVEPQPTSLAATVETARPARAKVLAGAKRVQSRRKAVAAHRQLSRTQRRFAVPEAAGSRLLQPAAKRPRLSQVSRWVVDQHKAAARVADDTTPKRSKGIAFLLALFLGVFGAHQFYLGNIGRGFIYLGLTALATLFVGLGALGILFGSTSYVGFLTVAIVLAVLVQAWLVSDIVRILTGDLAPKNGEYSDRFF
ncbi:TM2 domain-containing protein [Hymenobacter sp. 5317J-9]|uniref:TM2 domain-containing protein n=1 Tax=Hymenobacter sp. 5317J-9 TaxID=2932250 RepID=UPI001FD6D0A3|nr:TM2 domain-containing protein [Hymenobacter sp. 5317J-9]UOQ99066.1 TM2 domain-containing protein [Hymenobacter sp. 5317J-9]